MARLLAILLVALVLLGGLFVAERLGEHSGPPGTSELVALDADRITRVEIVRPEGPVTLEKGSDGWHLTAPIDAPADQALAEGAVRTMAHLVSNGVISRNPDKADTFEVDPAHGIRVSLFYADDASPKASVVVGKLAPGFTHTYATLADSPEVHRVVGPLRYQLQRTPGQWRDRAILRLDPAQVTRVAFVGAKSLTLEKGPDGWTPEGGGDPVPDTVVRRTLDLLAGLKAQSFVDTPVDAVANPLLTVSFWSDGEESPVDLVVETTDGDGYRVVSEANPQRYLVFASQIKELIADPARALAMPEGAAPPAP